MPPHELETERLVLRMLRETDLDAYAAISADPEVTRYLGDGKTYSRGEAWRSLAAMVGHWHLRGYGMWAVEEKASGQFIGRIGGWYPEGWPDFEVGWTLRREFWGQGFATEGARAAVKFAFEELKRPRVISLIHPENLRSIRVAQRLGEKPVGTVDVMGLEAVMYEILRTEWRG